jgi:hypothetical protein
VARSLRRCKRDKKNWRVTKIFSLETGPYQSRSSSLYDAFALASVGLLH